jgi:hypothetical protein
VALSEREPEDLVLAQELDHVPWEVSRLVDLRGAGRDPLPRQGANELADLALLVGKRVPRHTWILGGVRDFKPRMQVVVVVPEHLDGAGRPREASARPDEHEDGAGSHEAVDKILAESPVDLGRDPGRSLAAILPRVVHVDVEAVLVGRVPRAEGPAAPAAEIADPEGRRHGMGGCEVRHDTQDLADEEVRPPPPPGPVRPAVQKRIPCEEPRARRGKLDAADEVARGRRPESA